MLTSHQLVAEARAQIEEVFVPAAIDMIAAGAIVIDVREEHEFLAGNLPGAAHISRGVLEFKTANHPALANPNASILLYCRSGGRSALAALNLKRLGYTQVVSMAGGYEAWVAHHEPVIEDKTDFGG